MDKINRRTLPLLAISALGIISILIRFAISIMYQDMSSGIYKGSKVVLSLLALLFCIAAVGCALFCIFTVGAKAVSSLPAKDGLIQTFACACAGFFNVFCAIFIIYCLIKNITFFSGASRKCSFLLLIFTILNAAFFFVKSSSVDGKLKKNDLYPLVYIIPVAWITIRLYTLFREFSAHVIFINDKLQIVSLAVLAVYYLMECRFVRSEHPVKPMAYWFSAVFTLTVVPLSALPTFVFSLIYKTNSQMGEPILCLVELAMIVPIAVNFGNIYLAAKKEENNEA